MAANSLHNNLYLPDQVPLDLVFFLQGQDPGVAKIEFFVKDKTKRGMQVSAVVITLVDGTPGVSTVRLGNASVHLKRR